MQKKTVIRCKERVRLNNSNFILSHDLRTLEKSFEKHVKYTF